MKSKILLLTYFLIPRIFFTGYIFYLVLNAPIMMCLVISDLCRDWPGLPESGREDGELELSNWVSVNHCINHPTLHNNTI